MVGLHPVAVQVFFQRGFQRVVVDGGAGCGFAGADDVDDGFVHDAAQFEMVVVYGVGFGVADEADGFRRTVGLADGKVVVADVYAAALGKGGAFFFDIYGNGICGDFADLGGIAADVDVAGTQACIVAHRGVVDGGNQITAGCTVDGVAGNVQIVTGGVFVVAEFDAVSVYVVFEKGQTGNGVAADFVVGVVVGIQVFVLRVGLQLDA